MMSNVELTIWLLDKFNETTARDYFNNLEQKIETQELSEIRFQETNNFFNSEEESGVKCN